MKKLTILMFGAAMLSSTAAANAAYNYTFDYKVEKPVVATPAQPKMTKMDKMKASMTPEQKAMMAECKGKMKASMTHEQKAEMAKMEKMTPAERKAKMDKMTPAQKKAMHAKMDKMKASMTDDQKAMMSECKGKMKASMTADQKKAAHKMMLEHKGKRIKHMKVGSNADTGYLVDTLSN